MVSAFIFLPSTAFCFDPASHIKKGLIAEERRRKRVRDARHEWIVRRQPRMRQEPHRLVFIDETATKTNMTRLRGRSQKGERLYGSAPFGRWGTQTFIAGLTTEGMIAPWVISGAMDRAAFDVYVETQLAPELKPGTVVILDNLATHKSPHAADILRAHECWFLFLPPYSPDLNPIELAFSKLKAHLRRIGARTFDQLTDAIGDVCDLYSPNECWNFFKAAGYASH